MRVSLVLTHDCNLRCDYCYAGEKIPKVMPDRVAWQAIHYLFQQARPGQKIYVGYFGGEPLLEFSRLARYTRLAQRLARRKGLDIVFQVTTNATMLTPEILSFLTRYPFRVAFSVDGLGEDHDRHRPFASGKPSSAAVWRNLERAAGRLSGSSIQMVVSPDNLGGLAAALGRLIDLGYRQLSLLPNLDTDWGEAERMQARRVYREVGQLIRQSGTVTVRSFSNHRARACGFGDRDVAVSPSGALYPCVRLVGGDQRESIHVGHVRTGIEPHRVERLHARAQAKQKACGLGPGCQCQTFMPGDLARQMENSRFFASLSK